MTRPTTGYPEHATLNTTLTEANENNKKIPTTNLKEIGFDLNTVPTAPEENYWRNHVYLWLKYLDETTGAGTSGDLAALVAQVDTNTTNITTNTAAAAEAKQLAIAAALIFGGA